MAASFSALDSNAVPYLIALAPITRGGIVQYAELNFVSDPTSGLGTAVLADALGGAMLVKLAGGPIGGRSKTVLTPSSTVGSVTSAAVNTSGTPGTLCRIVNASSSDQPAILTLFDEGAGAVGAIADQIYSIALQAGQVITVDMPLVNGLAWSLNAACLTNIIFTYSMNV